MADQRRAGNLFPGYTLGTFEVVLSQQCPGSFSLSLPLFFSPLPALHLFVQKMKEAATGKRRYTAEPGCLQQIYQGKTQHLQIKAGI